MSKHEADQFPLIKPPRLIIVEGADCTGKTTLAKWLARRMGAVYWHATYHKSFAGGMDAYFKNILDNAEQCMKVCGLSVVLDRHWPSEHCYGKALRPDTYCHGFLASEHLHRASMAGAEYIFCFSDKASNRQLSSPDHSHPYSREEYGRVYQEYGDLSLALSLHMLLVNTYCLEEHGHDLETFYQKIKIYGQE